MKRKLILFLILLFCVKVSFAENYKATSFANAFTEGKAYLSLRYRFEGVDQDGIAKDAKASTLRSVLGFETASYESFNAKIEIEDVSEIGNDMYNNTINDKTQYPVVADVDGTEVNQAWLAYTGIEDTRIRAGREELTLDNHRFIGNVGWRQNHQTYDGVNILNESISDTKLFYGYVGNVNRIFGEDSAAGDFGTNAHLFNVNYTGIEDATITAYSYLLEVEDNQALSNYNFGLRLNGEFEMQQHLNFLYDLEYANQQDYADNPTDYSANYWRASAGASFKGLTLKGGYESLGSDSGVAAFVTPFATLHAWNGWADKFLTTPTTGLNDAYAALEYKIDEPVGPFDSLKFQAIYHDFEANQGSTSYGSEWDFNIVAKFLERYSFGVKYANYRAKEFASDTEKLIFSLATKFTQ